VNGKLTPHPIKAFTDPLRVTDAARFAGRRTFVYCSVGDVAVWASRMVARVRAEPGWRYRELATGHDAMITAPRDLAELLLELAQPRPNRSDSRFGVHGSVRSAS